MVENPTFCQSAISKQNLLKMDFMIFPTKASVSGLEYGTDTMSLVPGVTEKLLGETEDQGQGQICRGARSNKNTIFGISAITQRKI